MAYAVSGVLIPYIDLTKDNEEQVLEAVQKVYELGAKLLVRDIPGIEDNNPRDKVIRKLCDRGNIWVMAGSRTEGTATDMILLGVEKVLLQSTILPNLGVIDEVIELSSNVSLVIETEDGEISNLSGKVTLDALGLSIEEWHSSGMEDILVWPLDGVIPARILSDLSNSPLRVHLIGDPIYPEQQTILPFEDWLPLFEKERAGRSKADEVDKEQDDEQQDPYSTGNADDSGDQE